MRLQAYRLYVLRTVLLICLSLTVSCASKQTSQTATSSKTATKQATAPSPKRENAVEEIEDSQVPSGQNTRKARSQTSEEDINEELQRLIDEAEAEDFIYIVSALGQGRDASVKELFWRALLADPASPSLALAAAAELRALRRPAVSLNPAIAAALALKKKLATLKNGETFDFTTGSPRLPPRSKSSLKVAKNRGTVIAGETMDFEVQVTNTGKGDLFQVVGIVECNISDFNGAKIYFGRIAAGATARRLVAMAIPTTLKDQTANVSIRFSEANGYNPSPVRARVDIQSAPSPKLDIWSHAVDNDKAEKAVGNGDGLVQKGECVEIRIAVKNTGSAPARGVTVLVNTEKLAGVDIFGEQKFLLGDIAPGAFAERNFAVAIKPTFNGNRISISARASEFSDFAVEASADLSQRIGEKATQQILQLDKLVFIPNASALLSAASKDSRVLGTVPGGTSLRANGELGQFVRVEYKTGNGQQRLAWIDRKNIGEKPKDVVVASATQSTGIVVEYARIPPIIVMTNPKNGSRLQIEENNLTLNAVIQDPDSSLSDISLSINGRPWRSFLRNGQVVSTETRGIGGVKQAPDDSSTKTNGPKSFDLKAEIPLNFGENRLLVTVRDSDGETATAQAIVTRKQRTGRVFALVVGVNSYNDKNITSLNYAEADAKAFAQFLRNDPRSLVANPEHVKLLIGAKATRTAIVKELDSHLVKQATRPEDTAIFFYAGHGYSDGKRTFLTGSDSQLASLRATALEQNDLQAYWSDIRAERKLLFADACHSGGLQGLRGENTVSLGLASLGKNTEKGRGSVTILAAQPKQLSVESEKLGHGVFTHLVLEGLRGRADRNKDGRIAVSELVVFLDREVPALAKQKGQNQTPLHSISGGRGEIVLTR